MNEIFGKIVDKTESLTDNPHFVFNLLEIFYLMDVVSVIVFKEDIFNFIEKDFTLMFKTEYFLFVAIFLMSFFALYFMSAMARFFLSKIFKGIAIKIDDFVHKDKHGTLWSIGALEKFARENNKIILYEKVCEQKQKSVILLKQLDSNFLLGTIFFIHFAVCRNSISEFISAFIHDLKMTNLIEYWVFTILKIFTGIIVVFRFLHSFLSLAEYYSEHIESPEYDEYLKKQKNHAGFVF